MYGLMQGVLLRPYASQPWRDPALPASVSPLLFLSGCKHSCRCPILVIWRDARDRPRLEARAHDVSFGRAAATPTRAPALQGMNRQVIAFGSRVNFVRESEPVPAREYRNRRILRTLIIAPNPSIAALLATPVAANARRHRW